MLSEAGFGDVGAEEKEAGEGEPARRLLVRFEVRDLRRPCADEGRPGEPTPLPGEA